MKWFVLNALFCVVMFLVGAALFTIAGAAFDITVPRWFWGG